MGRIHIKVWVLDRCASSEHISPHPRLTPAVTRWLCCSMDAHIDGAKGRREIVNVNSAMNSVNNNMIIIGKADALI